MATLAGWPSALNIVASLFCFSENISAFVSPIICITQYYDERILLSNLFLKEKDGTGQPTQTFGVTVMRLQSRDRIKSSGKRSFE